MEMTVRMPANYNVMNEEEMTYTSGGAPVATYVAWGLGAAFTIGWYWNWLDLLIGARGWYAANKSGDLGTDLEKGVDAWVDYTTSSVVNCIRSICATSTAVFSPIGWIGDVLAFATV
ncbi:MAG TPA: hypothetical protein H9996_04330 [Candidatus Faecalibacterium avium]|uniref:hypothetical protein n=1 Tax=Faecalibacterium sp. An121 TaxID=1965550 RepID=UPI00117B013B|nr:hypothetical protein [Faecalibacterium sp. An121]HIV43418.1 hypothetical protein [Candidatus Faecalibacterium avium]